MNLNDEQGFLSDKFEDWSGEPIPNGWNDIEAKLGHKDRGKRFFWIFFPTILLAATFAYLGSRPDPVGLASDLQGKTSNPNTAASPTAALPKPQTASINQQASQSIEKSAGQQVVEDAAQSLGHSSPKSEPELNANKAGQKIVDPSVLVISGSRIRTRHSTLSFIRKKDRNKGSQDHLLAAAEGQNNIQRIRNRHSTLSAFQDMETDGQNGSATGRNLPTALHPAAGSGKGPQSSENSVLEPLSGKQAVLVLAPDKLGQPQEVPFEASLPPGIVPEKKAMSGAYHYSLGFQSGIATNRIQLRHAETQHQLKLRNANAIQSGITAVNGRFHYKAFSWLETYASVQLGLFQQVLDFDNKSRTPETYNVSPAGNGNTFQADPVWQSRRERLSQSLVFTSTEIGIRPQLFDSPSGPFAGMVIWTRLFQSSRSSLGQGSSFGSSAASIAFGYRAGYRIAFRNVWFVEGSVAGMPNELLPQTPGLQVVPTIYSLSLNRKF